MAKGRATNAKIAKGKQAKRLNEAGEEITTVKILKPIPVEGKPGVFRYREEMMDMVASKEKEVYGG